MSQSLDPYESYTPTGSRWLPEIPSQWDLLDGKRIFRNRREPSREDDAQLAASQQYGVIPQSLMMKMNDAKVMLALKGTSTFRHVEIDDFVISLRSFEGGIEHSAYVGCVSPAYTVLAAQKPTVSAYYKFLLKSGPFVAALQSSTDSLRDGKAISYSDFGSLKLPLPPQDEQKQIASFLDYETAKIDALIEKQQQLIALLGEKRQAVISHAVTKGLNPDAPMRDSGVQWLGEVPEHWTVMQLRRWIADMEQGKSPECENRPAAVGEWAVLKTGCVNGGVYNEEENKALPTMISPHEEYEVQVGDVLMSRASGSTDLIGSVVYVDATRSRNLLSDKIFRIRFWAGVDGKFFRYLMASSYMRDTIVRSISGAAGMANNITKTAILAFQSALPPVKEQLAIVAYIEKTTSRMESLIGKADDALILLQERRTALISAAVTGKIDVRGWKRPCADPKKETEMEVA